MLILLAAALADPAAPAIARMAALYDEMCLRTFPIDAQVDALMAKKGATPLTPEEVRTTLRDDPGRGWLIEDGDRRIQVTLELPPFHACSVRRSIPNGAIELSAYRAVVGTFKDTRRGFSDGQPYDADMEGIHIHATTEQRDLPGGIVESLMVFDQRITDKARRDKGETAINLRFVHQIRLPH